ncbi:hypothetical protein GUJ93_ZPchr0001g31824 [Zizania palustris]|uniref:Uncharacterized protein n=1 Tax=Zizania palustris TaxID=103762 RepID=A0A8J5VDI8_ZIZPA|nr:hypothetical protein GUJ93_ZPchr0001g31824 [Zizania palustris]
MVTNQCLTKVDSDRDVRYFELKKPSYRITYQVGTCLDQNCYIMEEHGRTRAESETQRGGGLEITGLPTLARSSAGNQVMSFFAMAEHVMEKLQYFASPEGRDWLLPVQSKGEPDSSRRYWRIFPLYKCILNGWCRQRLH